MAYNYEYPYTDPHRYNADWILNRMKELNEAYASLMDRMDTLEGEFSDLSNAYVTFTDEINEKIAYLSTLLEENILNITGVYDNVLAPKSSRIPGIFNLRIDGCKGADIVALASEYGAYISAGSACHSGDPRPSHVLKAIGLTDAQALSSVRISIGRFNGEQDIKYFCEMFPKIIKQLRFI